MEDGDKQQSLSYKSMQIFLPPLPFPNRTPRETGDKSKGKPLNANGKMAAGMRDTEESRGRGRAALGCQPQSPGV